MTQISDAKETRNSKLLFRVLLYMTQKKEQPARTLSIAGAKRSFDHDGYL